MYTTVSACGIPVKEEVERVITWWRSRYSTTSAGISLVLLASCVVMVTLREGGCPESSRDVDSSVSEGYLGLIVRLERRSRNPIRARFPGNPRRCRAARGQPSHRRVVPPRRLAHLTRAKFRRIHRGRDPG